jgi:hypothetical protein
MSNGNPKTYEGRIINAIAYWLRQSLDELLSEKARVAVEEQLADVRWLYTQC